MPNVIVRNIPPEIYNIIYVNALKKGISVEHQIREILQKVARELDTHDKTILASMEGLQLIGRAPSLNKEQIFQIQKLYGMGASVKEIAKKFNRSKVTIYRLLRRSTSKGS